MWFSIQFSMIEPNINEMPFVQDILKVNTLSFSVKKFNFKI